MVRQKVLDDKKQFIRWRAIVIRFKVKLVIMIKDVNCRFDEYFTSPKIRQILLHWGYDLV